MKHMDLWVVKRKPWPFAHAPPDGAFPAYSEPLGPGADDYAVDPDYPAEANIKNRTRPIRNLAS